MHIVKLAAEIVGSAGLGALALLLSLWAMRPYESPLTILKATYPEFLIALSVATAVFMVALWRMFHGSSFKAEARKLKDAAVGNDDLA
jgi:hypothetical protein